ncbi:cyclase family protein [Kordiimonas gwangyangensis]|uniref:cyclase family protein n=1 Tax=Kordiimonas gwangyangensis TaxID=288022 RepID=UPI000365C6D8|nr:cyclase family protein [Kordiimonas gwangyangensis]
MTDKRVCFDFEVDFSNGGGIQGQGFRLDIDGDDISDDALAAYIIADLRLLMVREVRILNKRIIEEAHKRGEAVGTQTKARPRHIDLSHTIEDGMVTYKGIPAPHICDHMSHAQSAGLYEEGTEFHFGRIDMVSNTGTYIDTPFHRFKDGDDLAAVGVHRVSGLPGVVVRLSGMEGRAIDWMSFAATDVKGRAVLVETGWSRHWRTDQYYEGHPFLTEAAAKYLRDQGAALVGIESLNIDDTSGGTRPVHTTLLGAGIPIVEHMTGLDALPLEGFSFFAAPPKVKGMGTFPVRAHAIITDEAAASA